MPRAILSSPLWVPAATFNPMMLGGFQLICKIDKFGGPLIHSKFKITPDDFHVIGVTPDVVSVASPTGSTAGGNPLPFPYLIAVPFTVPPSACDDDGEMAFGAIQALTDMITSFHIMMALFPETNGHVSVSIQSNQCGAPMRSGQRYIAVSKIDKMGRRLVYTAVDYVLLELPEDVPMSTVPELRAAIQRATVLANTKHIKAIIPLTAVEAAKQAGQQAPPKE